MSRLNQNMIDQHVETYEKMYLSPLLQTNPKNIVQEALKMVQHI